MQGFIDFLISPYPTFIVTTFIVLICRYFGFRIYKFAAYFTTIAITMGILASSMNAAIIYYYAEFNDFLISAIIIVFPIGLAIYTSLMFWFSLLIIHFLVNISPFLKSFVNFLTKK